MFSPPTVLTFSQRLFDKVFAHRAFEDEVFLCGGAFKSLVCERLKVADLDFWVRTKKNREKLRHKLLTSGARFRRDFKPYCILFDHEGLPVEINYQNVKDNPINFVLDSSDLAICAIGVVYEKGKVKHCVIDEQCQRSVKDRTIYLNEHLLPNLRQTHAPSLLRSLDRMEKAAQELGFQVAQQDATALWELFATYSEPEKRDCVDTYLATMVSYKGRLNAPILRQACSQLEPLWARA